MNEVKMHSTNSNNFLNINNSTSKSPMTTIDSIKMKLLIDSQNDNELHKLKNASNGIQKIKLHIKNEPLEKDNDFDQKRGKFLKKQKVNKVDEIHKIKNKRSSGEMNRINSNNTQKKTKSNGQLKSNTSRLKNSGATIYTNQTFARTRSSFGISVDQPILLDSSSDSENNDPNRFFGKKKRSSLNDNNCDKTTVIKNLNNGKAFKENIGILNRVNSKSFEPKSSANKRKLKDNISNKHNKKSVNTDISKQSLNTQLNKEDLLKQTSSIKSLKKSSNLLDEEKLPVESKEDDPGNAGNTGLKKFEPKTKSYNKKFHSTEKDVKTEDEKKLVSKRNLNESLQDLGKIPRKSKTDFKKLASLSSPISDPATRELKGLTSVLKVKKSKNESTGSQSIKVDLKTEQNGKIGKVLQNLDDDKKKETVSKMGNGEVIKNSSSLPNSFSKNAPLLRTSKNSYSTCCISCSKSRREDFCNRKKPCDICVGKRLKNCSYPFGVKIVQQQANSKVDLKLCGRKKIDHKSKKEAKAANESKLSKYLPFTTELTPQLSYSKNKEKGVNEADDESKSESEFDLDSDSEASGGESEIKVFTRSKKSNLKNNSSIPDIYKSDEEDDDDEDDQDFLDQDFLDNGEEDEQEYGDGDNDHLDFSVDDNDNDNDEYDDRKLSEKLAKREGSLKAQRVLQELEFDSRDLTGMFNNSRSRRNATKENYYVPSDEEDENSSAIAYEEAAARNECLILSEDEQERRMLRGNISKDFLESVRQERDKHMLHHNAHDSVSSDSDYE